jgi:hypothetical protein
MSDTYQKMIRPLPTMTVRDTLKAKVFPDGAWLGAAKHSAAHSDEKNHIRFFLLP